RPPASVAHQRVGDPQRQRRRVPRRSPHQVLRRQQPHLPPQPPIPEERQRARRAEEPPVRARNSRLRKDRQPMRTNLAQRHLPTARHLRQLVPAERQTHRENPLRRQAQETLRHRPHPTRTPTGPQRHRTTPPRRTHQAPPRHQPTSITPHPRPPTTPRPPHLQAHHPTTHVRQTSDSTTPPPVRITYALTRPELASAAERLAKLLDS